MDFLKHIQHKQHIIWDWNGTLFNDVGLAVNTLNQLLAEYKIPPLSLEEYKQQFGFPIQDFYQQIGFDFAQHDFIQAGERFVEIYMDNFHHYSLVQGSQSILKQIKLLNKTQSILSAAEQSDLEKKLDHFELTHFFEHIFGIHNRLAASKIDRGYALIDSMTHKPDETVLIGDTLHDLEVGQALGIDVILVDHGHQCGKRLRAVHEQVVRF